MRLTRRTFIACACCTTASPLAATASHDPGAPQALELGTHAMTRLAPTVWVAQIAPEIWLHTTTGIIDGGLSYPANGLILDRPDSAILIDTGWNPAQAETLLQWSKTRGHPITQALATHFHTDRTGGIPALQKAGIPTYAFPLTCTLASSHGIPAPTPVPGFTQGAHTAAADLEYFHPGPGHTRDNILVWLPRQRVLYGGCFLKSATAGSLGNVADADIADWPASLRRVRAAYPAPAIVIPGHGTIHGDSLAATHALLAKA